MSRTPSNIAVDFPLPRYAYAPAISGLRRNHLTLAALHWRILYFETSGSHFVCAGISGVKLSFRTVGRCGSRRPFFPFRALQCQDSGLAFTTWRASRYLARLYRFDYASGRPGQSPGVALAQGLWFTAQWLARAVQRLPVTELEVATLAFAS
ncbi:hypothetical protein B0H16DRAFT_1463238 [Mycena metata]|uniref:Uncharacterized protein n=1 Tax=Mycena metata TaxID=1033252 RepID=A0AAD7N3S4_9AGAR|nr:hypothetical protein B0H16DRAFT_1463238 [Mycena metata]